MRDRLLTIAMVAVSFACDKDHSLGQLDSEDAGGDAGADSGSASAADTAISTQADVASTVGAETQADSQPSQGSLDTQSSSMAEEVAVSPPLRLDAQPAGTAPETFPSEMDGLVGSWTGYVENYQFNSGSDVIKLVLSVDSAGRLGGKVTYGVGTPPPPATDPNVGYPANVDWGSGRPAYWEGFAYSILAATYDSHRLRFSLDTFELWSGWCALQPAPTDGSRFCIPQFSQAVAGATDCSITKLDGSKVPMDCGKLTLCFWMGDGVCDCSPAGCFAAGPDYPNGDTSFDVFVAAGTASGSVSGSFDDNNVHFIKD